MSTDVEVDVPAFEVVAPTKRQRQPRPHNPLHFCSLPLLTPKRSGGVGAGGGRSRSAVNARRTGQECANQLLEELRRRNKARLSRPEPLKKEPVWHPKKTPLSEATIRKIKQLFDVHSFHGQIGWMAFEDMSLKLGFRPDSGLQHLFSKFANENTGTVDTFMALRLLFPHINSKTLAGIHKQLQHSATVEDVMEAKDWRDRYDEEALEDLLQLYYMYAKQPVREEPAPRRSAATFGAHCKNLPAISDGPKTVRLGDDSPRTDPGTAPSGITMAQIRTCFSQESIPDDWIEDLFQAGNGSRFITLEMFAMAMEHTLTRKREPQGNLKLYFQQ
eukprot:GGOE01018826.1.p1 GENE.GGOE01018826.1~~GGOE01018826.1.p1  ORF type:complete len:331 (-),score=83.02 GGOE01018826.1:253-1245(-)